MVHGKENSQDTQRDAMSSDDEVARLVAKIEENISVEVWHDGLGASKALDRLALLARGDLPVVEINDVIDGEIYWYRMKDTPGWGAWGKPYIDYWFKTGDEIRGPITKPIPKGGE